MKYPPLLLTIALVIVFLAMLMVQNIQPEKEYITVSFEHIHRLNQPGPEEKMAYKTAVFEGNPIFLNEDLKDEAPQASAQLTRTSDSNEEESNWLDQITKNESRKYTKGSSRYLVLAGSYTDNMILLSKQAQYENKGLDAEIIRFDNKKVRHICVGRFGDQVGANAFAKYLTSKLDIKNYILDRAR